MQNEARKWISDYRGALKTWEGQGVRFELANAYLTEAQALYLRTRRVPQAQGFIFAPALKVGAFKELALALHATQAPNGSRPRLESVIASAA